MNKLLAHGKKFFPLWMVGIIMILPTVVSAEDFYQQRLDAIEQAYKSGVLTKEEYEFKKGLILKAREGAQTAPQKPSTTNGEQATDSGDYSGPSREFRAPDHSFITRVPIGWRSQTTVVNYQPAYVFSPPTLTKDKVAVGSGVTMAKTIEELADQARAWTQQTFPFLKPQGAPAITTVDGRQTVELRYEGRPPRGQPVKAWNGVILIDKFYYSVLAAAGANTAPVVFQQARFIFQQLTPKPIPENKELAKAIVGQWDFFHYNSSGVGSTRSSTAVSKRVFFSPDGRFEYAGGVYADANIPSGSGTTASSDSSSRGTFVIYGNQLLATLDDGSQSLFGLELLSGGEGLKINGALFLRE